MQNIVKSMLDEVGAMMSGHVIPYHKVAIVVAAVIALLFSLVFSHWCFLTRPYLKARLR